MNLSQAFCEPTPGKDTVQTVSQAASRGFVADHLDLIFSCLPLHRPFTNDWKDRIEVIKSSLGAKKERKSFS